MEKKFGIFSNTTSTSKCMVDRDGQEMHMALAYDEADNKLQVNLVTSYYGDGDWITDSLLFTTKEQIQEAITMLQQALKEKEEHDK